MINLNLLSNSNEWFCVCIDAISFSCDLQKDLNQVDTTTNTHPGNNVTARIKDDSRTAKTSPSKDEKKRRRDPNKHYISGM